MAPTSAAQDEFNAMMYGQGRTSPSHPHAEDSPGSSSEADHPSTSIQSRSKALRSGAITHSDSDSDSPQVRLGGLRANTAKAGRYYIPSIRSAANTGPKGVIADAQAFHDAKKAMRSKAASRAHLPEVLQVSGDEQLGQRPQTWLLDEDEEDGDDSGDEDFLIRWRQKRLRDMQSVAVPKETKGRGEKSRDGRWGSLVAVDAGGFLDAVEKSGETVVVVFIYDERSEVSSLIEQCVVDIARSQRSVRFIKLHYEEAQMEPAGVPALLAYKGGDKFAGLVPVLDEMRDDDDLSAEALTAALRRHSVL